MDDAGKDGLIIAPRTTFLLLGLPLVLAAAVAAFLGTGDRSAVAWGPLRAVVFESDDWGLAGFIPRADALEGLDRAELSPGNFPSVYWGSTLESAEQVEALADLMADPSRRGADNLPPVLQPNYILGSLAWERDSQGAWDFRPRSWPDYSPAYHRPGLAAAVAGAIGRGVWYPELHGAWHFDPERRREAVASDRASAEAASRDVMLFRGSERSWELGPWRPGEVLAAELDSSLDIFRNGFGRRPGSVIAPDYTWDSRVEDLWAGRGLTVIQGKREQRYPGRGWGPVQRAQKFLEQRWDRVRHRDRIYLERNCRFEPVQAPDPDGVAASCADEVRRAWKLGQPAIVETHRINFAHTDPKVVEQGLEAFARLLEGLARGPGGRPLYMVDTEVAQLRTRGVSVCRRGGMTIVRNGTLAARVVPLDPADLPDWVPDQGEGFPLLKLPPRSAVIMGPGFEGYALWTGTQTGTTKIRLLPWGPALVDDELSPAVF